MEKHVITGGSGFIGRHVAWLLASQGNTVTIASRTPLNFQFAADISKYISCVPLDIADADWDKLLEDADVCSPLRMDLIARERKFRPRSRSSR